MLYGSSLLVPNGSVAKEYACNIGDTGNTSLIPGLGRFPGGGNGNPLQYSCLGNPMDSGAWWATVHGVAKSQDTTEHVSRSRDISKERNVCV